jgi:hypothetical protein
VRQVGRDRLDRDVETGRHVLEVGEVESSAVITHACSSSNRKTVPSPTILPSASQNGA